MELWIRSQDGKTLMKVDRLDIDYSSGLYSIKSNGFSTLLANYKSEERAIEVLNEIQNILKPKYILDTSSIKPDEDFYEENGVIFQKYNANARIEELSTFVYQIPKE